MSSKTKPEQIKLTKAEADALADRIRTGVTLTPDDIKIMTGLISFNIWLQSQLSRAKLTINSLKKLFGFKTEKKNSRSSKVNDDQKNTDLLCFVVS